MKKWYRKMMNPLHNKRGNLLTSAFIAMVIMSMSVAGIAQLTVQQYTQTKIKLNVMNDDLLGEALLEQAIYDFENYLETFTYDFTGYMNDMTTGGYTEYGIFVENVTGTIDENGDYTDFGDPNNLESRVYRFTYFHPSGGTMVMYSYIASSGTVTESLNPFDFPMASNGYLMINSGYLRNPSIFGQTIVFGNVSPFINYALNSQDVTPTASGEYPDFNGNGAQTANVYFGVSFNYCEPVCWDTSGTTSDPFVFQDSELLDVFDDPNPDVELGAVNDDKIISDFFGGYELEDDIIYYVKNDGPTDAQTIVDGTITLANLGSTIWNSYSGLPEETCVNTQKNKNKPPIWVCYDDASSEPYTQMNTFTDFDPSSTATELDFAGIYNGDLVINEDFRMTNVASANTETFIVNGDLTFSNTGTIFVDAMIVVLGDLTFEGDSVQVGGGFYVTGQTFVDFNPDKGFDDPGNESDYSFSLLTMDNVLITSIFESHDANDATQTFNWFIYTEESIYADCVNNRLYVNGVFFAAGKGVSGNYIPIEDESGDPILGIVINAFNGYVDNSGTLTIRNNFNSFDFDPVNEASLTDEFLQLPEFETLTVSEGVYTFERSEIFYN